MTNRLTLFKQSFPVMFTVSLLSSLPPAKGYAPQTPPTTQTGLVNTFEPVAFDVSPDGNWIVFCSTKESLFLYSLQNHTTKKLTGPDVAAGCPVFSPNGKYIAYSQSKIGEDESRILVRSLETDTTQQVTVGHGVVDGRPRFSPDSNVVLFIRAHRKRPYAFGGQTWDHLDIYRVNRDGSDVRRLTNGNYYSLTRPAFLNPSTVLYSDHMGYSESRDNVNATVFAIPISGGKPSKWFYPKRSRHSVTITDIEVLPKTNRVAIVADIASQFKFDVNLIHSGNKSTVPLGVIPGTSSTVFDAEGKSMYYLDSSGTRTGEQSPSSLYKIDFNTKKVDKVMDWSLFDQ